MTRRDFGSVRRLPSGSFRARYTDRNGRTRGRNLRDQEGGREYRAAVCADLSRGRWQDPVLAPPVP